MKEKYFVWNVILRKLMAQQILHIILNISGYVRCARFS